MEMVDVLARALRIRGELLRVRGRVVHDANNKLAALDAAIDAGTGSGWGRDDVEALEEVMRACVEFTYRHWAGG